MAGVDSKVSTSFPISVPICSRILSSYSCGGNLNEVFPFGEDPITNLNSLSFSYFLELGRYSISSITVNYQPRKSLVPCGDSSEVLAFCHGFYLMMKTNFSK